MPDGEVIGACPACRAELSQGARFCHLCGTPLGRRPGRKLSVPWIGAGAALTAFAIVAAMRFGVAADRGSADTPSGVPPLESQAASRLGPAPDISAMSPRERADRLFDRVMAASERGDTEEAHFFGRMAIDAYALLDELDDDAHYHLALIHMTSGDTASARSELGDLEASSPRHLLLSVARAELLRTADPAALRREYRAFLERYDEELASGREEYRHHLRTLEAFGEEARRVLGDLSNR